MIYDYQNCIDYAVEQAVEKAAKENLAKGLAEGEAKGKAEGKIEGKIEGEKLAKIETARNFKSRGIGLKIISECTGLSIKEITEL